MSLFNLESNFQHYLETVGLKENEMYPRQRTEIKRAFYGGCGEILTLLLHKISQLDDDAAEEQLSDLVNQVSDFWLSEQGRNN